MKTLINFLVAAALSSMLIGCNYAQLGAMIGSVAGGVGGQAIGRNTESTLIGVAVGTMLGYMIGNEMDKNDKKNLNAIYETGVSGQTVGWQNPDNGNQFAVTPQYAYAGSGTGQPCREAQIQSMIDGRAETLYTVACRDQGGYWQVQ